MLLNHFRFTLTHLPKAPLRRAPGVLSPFHFSAPVFEEEKKKDGPADLDTSFLTDVYQREDYTEGESSFAGHIAPYRPGNVDEQWKCVVLSTVCGRGKSFSGPKILTP